jgi:hypothetical protein
MKKMMIARGIKWGVLMVLFVALFTYGTMLLWNALIPQLFAGPVLTFWQAAGLLILSKILFGGFRKGGGWRGGHFMQQRWKEKMARMTPEEKEKFKGWMERRCGRFSGESEKPAM